MLNLQHSSWNLCPQANKMDGKAERVSVWQIKQISSSSQSLSFNPNDLAMASAISSSSCSSLLTLICSWTALNDMAWSRSAPPTSSSGAPFDSLEQQRLESGFLMFICQLPVGANYLINFVLRIFVSKAVQHLLPL